MYKKGLFLFVALIAFILSGCSGSRADILAIDSIYVTDVANDGVLSPQITTIWNTDYVVKNALSQRSASFDGLGYTGDYRYSCYNNRLSYITDYYYLSDGRYITFNADTGDFTGIGLTTRDYYDTAPFLEDIPESEEYALEKAKEIAKGYVDINEYEIILEPNDYSIQQDDKEYTLTSYRIRFVKKIGSFETNDYVYICISSKGNIVTCQLGDIGKFDKLSVTDIPFDDIEDKVAATVQDMYGNSENYTYISHEIREKTLLVTPDEDYCVATKIAVNLRNQEDLEFSTGLELAVILK